MKTRYEKWTLVWPEGNIETVKVPTWANLATADNMIVHCMKFLHVPEKQSMFVQNRIEIQHGPFVALMLDNGEFAVVDHVPTSDSEAYHMWRDNSKAHTPELAA